MSGSAIVRGTGTKFKNNNPAINIGMTILIKSGNTNIPYMIKSVNSDTELVLAQPALVTATNTTFSIHITEPDNNSDAARTMVAINSYVEYFLDAMNTWMTQTGQTKIEMPNGEVVTLDSIKKMQGDIADKFDKKGGTLSGPLSVKLRDAEKFSIHDINEDEASFLSFYGKGKREAFLGFAAVGRKSFTLRNDKDNATVTIDNAGIMHNNKNVMFVGDYGVGNQMRSVNAEDFKSSGFFTGWVNNVQYNYMGISSYHPGGDYAFQIFGRNKSVMFRTVESNVTAGVFSMFHSGNTMIDSNGFYKKASPIIDINTDGTFTTNDESEGATVTRVAKGEYLIEGVLGFNADAGWGGVDGGIEIPLDVNKQPLIWVNSEINKDGSILVKTYHRTHPNAPKFARNEIDGFNDGDPIDIPAGRFISVRVQMPEQSIYNVRMREMEDAQKAEEERRQKEEEENQDTNKTPKIDN
ncbi:TPA: hypothetical protein SMP78_003233 [Proteus mirabilis]